VILVISDRYEPKREIQRLYLFASIGVPGAKGRFT